MLWQNLKICSSFFLRFQLLAVCFYVDQALHIQLIFPFESQIGFIKDVIDFYKVKSVLYISFLMGRQFKQTDGSVV